MSVRREARARVPILERPSSPSAMPAALAIGRCVDVWADERAESPQSSAMLRFGSARAGWAASIGADADEMRQLIPNGAPWSIEFLTYRGQADRSGRAVSDVVAERLDRAGCTIADLPVLREEAEDLYLASLKGSSLGRAYLRHRAKGRGAS